MIALHIFCRFDTCQSSLLMNSKSSRSTLLTHNAYAQYFPISPPFCSHSLAVQLIHDLRTDAKSLAAVGFEPTPPRRLVPKTSALDRSATLPSHWIVTDLTTCQKKGKATCIAVTGISGANVVQPTQLQLKIRNEKCASAGSRTRIDCLEGNHANRYTTDALHAIRHSLMLYELGQSMCISCSWFMEILKGNQCNGAAGIKF